MGISAVTTSAAIQQWVSAHEQKEEEYGNLMSSLEQLKHLPTDEAFLLMMMLVMPQAMSFKSDSLGISSSQLNISTSLSQIITNITNDANGIKPSNTIPAGQAGSNQSLATDLIAQCNKLNALLGTSAPPEETWTNKYTHQSESQSWIDQGTWSHAVNSLKSLTSLLQTSLGAAQVVSNITGWTSNPNTQSGGQTGEQCLSQMNSSLTQEDNTFGGLSQMAQNSVNFLSSLFQQLQSCTKTLLQDVASFNGVAVQNLRSS